MGKNIYEQIVSLRNEMNDVKRGYSFEALIREIMPWDKRPPVVMNPQSEQLDGVFVYRGTTYIIESKAKKGHITAGNSDWEDFELKMRKREQSNVIGIYCSLFDVHDNVLEAARDLNKKGISVTLFCGKFWDELKMNGISFNHVLEYAVLIAQVKYLPTIDSFENLKKWSFDMTSINNKLQDISKKKSSIFLRRDKHPYHERLYVSREIDELVKQYTENLKPSNLKTLKINREDPKQILVVRDYSGSGKTTLALDLILNSESAFFFGNTANSGEIDVSFDRFLDEIYSLNYLDYGIDELKVVNKPIVYIIDSLDEVAQYDFHQKKKEIKSLFKIIEDLNKSAQRKDMRIFPVLIIFTIREDYWNQWVTSFEGRHDVATIQKRITNYNTKELDVALKNYTKTYQYKITNTLSEQSKKTLSIPINLEIFSKANEFEGDIVCVEAWESKILGSFFDKKKESVYKRRIDNQWNETRFIKTIASLAFYLVVHNKFSFSKNDFQVFIDKDFVSLSEFTDEILLQLVSEHILTINPENKNTYRFLYNKFIEYLVAKYIILRIDGEKNYAYLEYFTKMIFKSTFISMYSVLDKMKNICKEEYPELEVSLMEYYSKSKIYLSKRLPYLRSNLAFGGTTPEDDMKMLIEMTITDDPQIMFDTFFIITAKNNHVSKRDIIDLFKVAWDVCAGNSERWKFLDKLSKLNYLINESVATCLLQSATSKEWEVYLGSIEEKKLNADFKIFWEQLNGNSTDIVHFMKKDDFEVANKILSRLLNEERDSIFKSSSNNSSEKYIILNYDEEHKLRKKIDHQKSTLIDSIVESITIAFEENTLLSFVISKEISSLNDIEVTLLNIRITKSFEKYKSQMASKPFLNYVFSNNSKYRFFINFLLENNSIQFDCNSIDLKNTTLLQDIIKIDFSLNSYSSKNRYYEYIYANGYKKNEFDEEYFKNKFAAFDSLLKTESENLLLGYVYYRVGNTNKKLVSTIQETEKLIFILYSIKYKQVLGSGFKNLIGVCNHAIDYYEQFGVLILQALYIYDLEEELLQKKSFNKKVQEFKEKRKPQNNSYNDLLKILFHELAF